jgi:DNA end-binding protein Ku
MRRTGKAGLAKFVLAEREYLVAIKSSEGALALVTLHYSDEILPAADLAPQDATVAAADKKRMQQSIEKLLKDFQPEKYANQRREKVLELLTEKRGSAMVTAPEVMETEEEGPADLVAALEEIMRQMKEKQ